MKKSNRRIKGICLVLAGVMLLSVLLTGCGGYAGQEREPGGNGKNKQAPGFTKDNIRRFSVIKDGETVLELLYNPADYKKDYEAWTITVPYEKKVIVNTEKMLELFEKLDGFQALESKDAAAEKGGKTIPDNPRAELVIDYEKENETLGTSRFYLGERSGDGTYPVVTDGNAFYSIPESLADELLELNPYDYILKIAFISNIDNVSEVTIRTGSGTYRMRCGKDGFFLNEDKVSEESFHKLYTELMSVLIQKEIGTEGAADTDQEPLLTLSYKYNKKDMEDQIIKFLPYDENYARVQVDGTQFFLVNLADVENLIQTIENNYR